jgi:hypothetical protein
LLSEIAEEISDEAEELNNIDAPPTTDSPHSSARGGFKRRGRANYGGFRKKRFKRGSKSQRCVSITLKFDTLYLHCIYTCYALYLHADVTLYIHAM